MTSNEDSGIRTVMTTEILGTDKTQYKVNKVAFLNATGSPISNGYSVVCEGVVITFPADVDARAVADALIFMLEH